MFKSAGLVTPGNEAQIKATLAASFKGNEGVTLRHVGVVATTGFSSFPGRESFNENLITNLTVHEGGHAVSRRSPDWDHTTGGVMARSIDPFDRPLHYTATFLQQFVREKAKKKARTKKR